MLLLAMQLLGMQWHVPWLEAPCKSHAGHPTTDEQWARGRYVTIYGIPTPAVAEELRLLSHQPKEALCVWAVEDRIDLCVCALICVRPG